MLEFLFNTITGLQAGIFIKKRLEHRCFPVKDAKYLRTPIFRNICEQLLLSALSFDSFWESYQIAECLGMLDADAEK